MLTKWQVEKNGKLTKGQANKMASWQNGNLTNWHLTFFIYLQARQGTFPCKRIQWTSVNHSCSLCLTHKYDLQKDICSFGSPETRLQIYSSSPTLTIWPYCLPPPSYLRDPLISITKRHLVAFYIIHLCLYYSYLEDIKTKL